MTEEGRILAGELALGVLDGDARAEALRRVLAEPAFAAEVERWRLELAALNAEWPEAEPSAATARRIAAIGAPADVAPAWRRLAAAASVAAAVLLVLLVARPTPPAPGTIVRNAAPAPLLVAVLAPSDAAPFAVIVDPAARAVRLPGPARQTVPDGRDAEFWLIGADGTPRAAGLLSDAPSGRLKLRPGLDPRAGVTLAISIEPVGGSPKAVPTGPVIATGVLIVA